MVIYYHAKVVHFPTWLVLPAIEFLLYNLSQNSTFIQALWYEIYNYNLHAQYKTLITNNYSTKLPHAY